MPRTRKKRTRPLQLPTNIKHKNIGERLFIREDSPVEISTTIQGEMKDALKERIDFFVPKKDRPKDENHVFLYILNETNAKLTRPEMLLTDIDNTVIVWREDYCNSGGGSPSGKETLCPKEIIPSGYLLYNAGSSSNWDKNDPLRIFKAHDAYVYKLGDRFSTGVTLFVDMSQFLQPDNLLIDNQMSLRINLVLTNPAVGLKKIDAIPLLTKRADPQEYTRDDKLDLGKVWNCVEKGEFTRKSVKIPYRTSSFQQKPDLFLSAESVVTNFISYTPPWYKAWYQAPFKTYTVYIVRIYFSMEKLPPPPATDKRPAVKKPGWRRPKKSKFLLYEDPIEEQQKAEQEKRDAEERKKREEEFNNY